MADQNDKYMDLDIMDYCHVERDGVLVIKEEIRELERLLKEAKTRLNIEYYKNGQMSWFEYFYSFLFGY
tara:strand:- start:2353 stop:2559 length:207 start_codon:yes stop_codon:yes gene_type:complete